MHACAALCTLHTLCCAVAVHQSEHHAFLYMHSHICEAYAQKSHLSDLHLCVHKHCIIQTCSYTVCLFRQQQL